MATKNVVPRTGSEGEIGTSAKPWNKGHFNYLSVTGSDSTGVKFGGSLLADKLNGPFDVHTDTDRVTIHAGHIAELSSSTLLDLYSGGGFRAEADSNISFEGRNQFVVDVENEISLTTENSNLILQSNAAYPGPGYKIQLNGPQIQLTASGPVEVESSLFDVSGSSRFGNELTDTHIFTGSFHQTGSGATSVFTDHITIKRSPAATSTAFLTVGVDTPASTTNPANTGFLYLGGPSSYGGHLRFLHNDTTSSAMIYNAGPDLFVASSASFEFEAGAAIDGSPIQSSGNDFRFRHTNQASGSFEVDVHGNVEIDAQEDILINAGTGMVLDGGAGLFSIDLRSPTYIGRSFDNKDLQVWGNITASGHVSASAFYGDGQYLDNIATDAELAAEALARSNADGVLAGSISANTSDIGNNTTAINNLDLDAITTVGNTTANSIEVTNITASGHVSASAFFGDGSGITGVTAEWDGTHTGDAEITGTLALSPSGSTSIIVEFPPGSGQYGTSSLESYMEFRGQNGGLTGSTYTETFTTTAANPFAPNYYKKIVYIHSGSDDDANLRITTSDTSKEFRVRIGDNNAGGADFAIGSEFGFGANQLSFNGNGPMSLRGYYLDLFGNGGESNDAQLLTITPSNFFSANLNKTKIGHSNDLKGTVISSIQVPEANFPGSADLDGGSLNFQTFDNNVGTQTRVTISPSGSFGIGTTQPNDSLTVVGDHASMNLNFSQSITPVTNNSQQIVLTGSGIPNYTFIASTSSIGNFVDVQFGFYGQTYAEAFRDKINTNASSHFEASVVPRIGPAPFYQPFFSLVVRAATAGVDGNSYTVSSSLETSTPSTETSLTGGAEATVVVSGSVETSGDIETLGKVTTPRIDVQDIHSAGGIREAALSPGQFLVMNDFVAGKNDTPDTFAVDYTESKVAVGYDLADVAALADQFTVSGSTKFGNLSTDTHKFTGSVDVSVNISASAFYGNIDITQPGGGTYYPVFANTLNGEATLGVDASMSYNNGLNTLYIPNVTSANGLISFHSASGDLLTMDDTTTPAAPTDAAHLYAITGSMYVQDTGGNETKISPHDEHGEWEYFSRNTKTGKVVRIRMERMIRKLEELTGETFIEEE